MSSMHEQDANALLPFICRNMPLMCFDLDYTLWPAYCDEETRPPYVNLQPDEKFPYRVACQSRKGTGRLRLLQLFPEVRHCLEWCVANDIPISICSKSQNCEAAKGILTSLGLWSKFKYPQIYYRRKSCHFRSLKGGTCYLVLMKTICVMLLFFKQILQI